MSEQEHGARSGAVDADIKKLAQRFTSGSTKIEAAGRVLLFEGPLLRQGKMHIIQRLIGNVHKQ
jgi:hypothetical protein